MKKSIQFFHPDETLTYHIKKSICKVVYQENGYFLLIEIESTDELDHVEEDSIQNEYPEIMLTVDDFPLEVKNLQELVGKTIEIPTSSIEVVDEDGMMDEVFYTNLQVKLNDYELNSNTLYFYENQDGEMNMRWRGIADDFTEEVNEGLTFDLICAVNSETQQKVIA